jgi:hypothetical protein
MMPAEEETASKKPAKKAAKKTAKKTAKSSRKLEKTASFPNIVLVK